MLKAICNFNGAEVKPGDHISDFRGDVYTLVKLTRPRMDDKAGKVVVRACDPVQFVFGCQWNDNPENPQREYYDTVFDLEVRVVHDGEPDKNL